VIGGNNLLELTQEGTGGDISEISSGTDLRVETSLAASESYCRGNPAVPLWP